MLTEERAKEILDEITAKLDTRERFVEFSDSVPMNLWVYSGKEKIKFRRDYVETMDEGEFKYAVAFLVSINDKTERTSQSLTTQLASLIVMAPLLAAYFVGERLPDRIRPFAWPLAIITALGAFAAFFYLSKPMAQEEHMKRALKVTGDVSAAERFYRKETRWSSRVMTSPEQRQKQIDMLHATARKLELERQ